MKRETVSLALNSLDDRHIGDTAVFSPETIQSSPERIVLMKKKRMMSIVLAAALSLALAISAYAIFGHRFVVSRDMPNTGEYTDLSDLAQIEKTVGYDVTVPMSFSNGYAFSILTVRGEAVVGETGEVEKEYYGVHVDYTKPGSPNRYLELNPVLGESQPEPTQMRIINGVPVKLNLDHYKTVPENYQKTQEDIAREAEGHFFISFGSDRITEYDIASAEFVLGGVDYMLMDMAATAATAEDLVQMAEEVIAAAD